MVPADGDSWLADWLMFQRPKRSLDTTKKQHERGYNLWDLCFHWLFRLGWRAWFHSMRFKSFPSISATSWRGSPAMREVARCWAENGGQRHPVALHEEARIGVPKILCIASFCVSELTESIEHRALQTEEF